MIMMTISLIDAHYLFELLLDISGSGLVIWDKLI